MANGKEEEKKSYFALYVELLGCWLPEGGQNGDGNGGTGALAPKTL